MEVSSQLHAPAALPSREEPTVPIGLGEPQSQSARCGEEKILNPTRTRTPTPRSSSLQLVAINRLYKIIKCFPLMFRYFIGLHVRFLQVKYAVTDITLLKI
jgi:hypothetical protein